MNEKILKKIEFNKVLDMLKECAASSAAKDMCENLQPQKEFSKILKMLNETSDAVRMSLKKGNITIGGLKDIRLVLEKVEKGGYLNGEELIKTADSLSAFVKIKKYGTDERSNETFDFIQHYFDKMQTFKKLEAEIYRCIIASEEVADNASKNLLSIRNNIKINKDRIKSKLNSILNSAEYRDKLQDAVITMRNDRYCLPVKQEHKSTVKGMIHDTSATGSTVFIEPQAIVEINNKVTELKVKEKIEIDKILRELTNLVLEDLYDIKNTYYTAIKLDFIFAKAKYALSDAATYPKINKDKITNIIKGRHPLIEKEEVVPIDINIGRGFNTLIITGPNTGGKTVTLKTVGLLTIMAQSGLFIPAKEGSDIGIYSEIYADIGDEQSIEQSLSTFSSHMVNIVDILDKITCEDLVLFDELGAGTDPVEGAALAISILTKLLKQNVRTMATTHYSELKVFALSTENVQNASCEFNVETLMPTYKILIGVPGKSNAFAISSRLGLKDDVIKYAKETISTEELKFEDILTDLEISRKETEENRELIETYKKEIEGLRENLETEKNKLKVSKEKILNEANKRAKEILEDAKEKADTTIKELNKEARALKTTLNTNSLEMYRGDLRDGIKDKDKNIVKDVEKAKKYKKLKSVKKGDHVFAWKLNKEVQVDTNPDRDGYVFIKAGILKMKVHTDDLTESMEKTTKVKHRNIEQKSKVVIRQVKMEVNVIGENSLDAIDIVDKFIDDAVVSNLSTIRIVHGRGTGVLRTQIHKYLKNNKNVKSYQLASHYEGGVGATVVELK